METGLLLVIITIAVALTFDFLNGFHDAANSIATVVSTRVLSPKLAVLWAAFFNFVAAFFLGTAVAKTIGKGMIHLEMGGVQVVTQYVVLAGLLGAIVWDLLTWLWGLPTSSSHALIGGYAGAAVAKAGYAVIIASGWTKTLIFIVVAPFLGLLLGWLLMVAVFWIFRRYSPRNVDSLFRKLQLVSAGLYSLGHGGNDAQKTMGIIASALYTGGLMSKTDIAQDWGNYHWPIILSAHTAIALGTYFGGWRIVHTMGSKITKLKPVGGFCAETAGAITLFGTAIAGIPVSTTHTITGAIIGVGATNRLSAVRWGVAKRIVWAWVLTIPASAAVSALTYWLIAFFKPGA
ncbi:MAG TPA: inorganic phosphate transporter [Terriglobales bacterium]|nr:inorganic phosphate transporter [Terriglobales bacterium]